MSDFDSEVTFGKLKKRQARPKTRDGANGSIFAGAEPTEPSEADLEQETLHLKPKPTSRDSNLSSKSGLSFADEEVRR